MTSTLKVIHIDISISFNINISFLLDSSVVSNRLAPDKIKNQKFQECTHTLEKDIRTNRSKNCQKQQTGVVDRSLPFSIRPKTRLV